MNFTKETIIGALVGCDYRAASVFKQFGIDFCCNGNRTIEEACKQINIDGEQLIAQLSLICSQRQEQDSRAAYNSWPLDLLVDYIEKKHHRYVEEKITEITPFLEKVTQVHGKNHPELLEVRQLFNASAAELTAHMKKEEGMLFPYIRKMVASEKTGVAVQAPFGTIQNPIRMMMYEHDGEGERFRKITRLTNGYTLPEDACNTYRVTLALLKEFEEDLHLHIHLENNILFPKSIQMEASLVAV